MIQTNSVNAEALSQWSKQLRAYYSHLESDFQLTASGKYTHLVVPNGNSTSPIHRWFHLKEAYSADLLPKVVDDIGFGGVHRLRVLDPFAGSGTTGVSLGELTTGGHVGHAQFYGIECNPFLHLLASTKFDILQRPSITFGRLARKVAAAAHRSTVDTPTVPALATFHKEQYFDQSALETLLRLRRAIEIEAAAGANPLDVNLALVCLAGSIEPVSSLRRDGRALRYVPLKPRSRPIEEFLTRAEWIDEDMPSKPLRIEGSVAMGDGRTTTPLPPSAVDLDLVLFSPPYPNNIDYTEVYKMEAWLLGLISDAREFTVQRLKTVYSHPSIDRPLSLPGALRQESQLDVRALVRPIIQTVPDDRYRKHRRHMILGYFSDMASAVTSAYDRLRTGGYMVYVVGNSLHGTQGEDLVIAADLLMAIMAQAIGFRIERFEVARTLHRRHSTSPFLRESVVFARKTER